MTDDLHRRFRALVAAAKLEGMTFADAEAALYCFWNGLELPPRIEEPKGEND